MLHLDIRRSFVFLILGSILLTGCRRSESTAGAARGEGRTGLPVKEVRLAAAQEHSLMSRVSAPGTLAADEQATVSFKVPGRLSLLRVDLGSRVAKGQEVALLETEDFRVRVEQSSAALQQARARLGLPPQGEDDRIDINKSALVAQAAAVLDEARANRERTIRLVRDGVQPQAELDRTESVFKVAESRYQDAIEEVRNRQAVLLQRRSELAIARQQLAETRLYAPFDGAVRERRASVGEYLTAGTPVLTVVRIHPLRLRVEIPERDSRDLRVGQGVRVSVEGDPETYPGRLVRLSPAFQELSRTLIVEAEVDNRHSKLRPGSFAKAEIETNSRSTAVMVPASAVVTFAGIQKVYLVKDGSAIERNIQVGRTEGELVEITDGLKAGEKVVTVPGNLVVGQPVKVLSENVE
jgi:membrane fusion protein, multidrug efflux system